ncbi:hypothetical protein B0J13DRAFT_556743 [Dactylonectria estremocensis]|uniref:Uncharacterized protein n=1 Tax=Dactylonectria estremocensis TaxID=1079267 RepID=A0A9P9EQ78_9HYPO|nr:hypothetical protein B0J13DRAFT_556743 [Dactylonectria estremocensis]
MKRCTAVCSGRARIGFGLQPRRWASHDRSRLTDKALLKQAESQLGLDVDGNPVRIDKDTKTVGTAVGSLPISPIMDPDWIRGGRRQMKRPAGLISGQFRKKLSNNPFAMALMSPVRHCHNTDAHLPRYFLQEFELIEHPVNEDEAWWAPGPFALDSIIPDYEMGPFSMKGRFFSKRKGGIRKPRAKIKNEGRAGNEGIADKAAVEAAITGIPVPSPKEEPSTTEEQSTDWEKEDRFARHQAPVTTYFLSRKAVIEVISNESASKKGNKPGRNRFIHIRQGTATAGLEPDTLIWRSDMHEFLLKQQRRYVVDALIYRAQRSVKPEYRFLKGVANWNNAKMVDKKGCVLWQADRVDPIADSYATMDLNNPKFAEKMPVHNLTWLLGEEELQRLRESSKVFRDNKIVVLKLWRSESMRKLHLLLWRLQGYQAEKRRGNEEPDVERPNIEKRDTQKRDAQKREVEKDGIEDRILEKRRAAAW